MLGKTMLCAVLFVSISLAATVHGTIYDWATLEPLNGSIVQINSTPVQQYVSNDGVYSFNLGLGDYEITARYYENNSLELETTESITITSEGDYVLDLIMFPSIDLGEPLFNETVEFDEEIVQQEQNWLGIVILSVVLTTIILFIGARFRFGPREYVEEKREEKPKRLPKESKQVLDMIKEEGRITQKELRKKLPWSEAKVSLAVSDLEERGLIKKIKKGRGNILKIE